MFSNIFILLALLYWSVPDLKPSPANRHPGHPVSGLPLLWPGDNPHRFISEIPLPAGFARVKAPPTSFAAWLRRIRLKKDKSVYLYNGALKFNQEAQFAVLDITVGKQNLQQCADAIMRLRAEYFYQAGNFSNIKFIDNEQRIYQFTVPYTRTRFEAYLQKVFGMCGTASLSKQLKKKPVNLLSGGDVFIRGGFPGHAVLVVDMAENARGEKIYLLAQSYMPAQDIHVLINPVDKRRSPWYVLNNNPVIETPEYRFTPQELKEW
jgi:hypothetical protein